MAVDEVDPEETKYPRVTKRPEGGWGEEFDENGKIKDPVYINGYNPTTRFHPSELPSNPVARAQFPKNLIDENHVTQSPMSDAPPEQRYRRAADALAEETQRYEDAAESARRRNEEALESLPQGVRDHVEKRRAELTQQRDDSDNNQPSQEQNTESQSQNKSATSAQTSKTADQTGNPQ